MLHNSQHSYGWVAISIHWLSAIVVLAMFAVGYWMVDLSYYSEWYKTAPHYHKSVGLLLTALTLFRLGWKIKQVSPQALGNKLEQIGAKLGHIGIYALLMAIFISGYLISTADGRGIEVFNWFTLPGLGELFPDQEDIAGLIHEWLAYGLMALVAVHSLAAIKHHFIDKDLTLKRMLKPLSKN